MELQNAENKHKTIRTQVKKQLLNENFVGYWFVCIVTLFLLFFIINYLTPALADDFNYINYWKNFHENKTDAFHGFISSVKGFYKSWGGRIMGYTFMILFNTMPPLLFDLLNSVFYILLTYLIYKISNFRGGETKFKIISIY